MLQNNNLFPLAIYDDLQKQDRFKWYASLDDFALPYTFKKIPPFQLIVTETGTFANAILTRISDGWTKDITTNLNDNHTFTKVNSLPGDYAILVNYSNDLLDVGGPTWTTVDYGLYYIQFDYNGTTYYSEVFNWCEDTTDLLKITYSHAEHFPTNDGLIYYDGTYQNEVYLYSELGKPEYENEEDAEIRDGIKFSFYKTSFKKYRFTFYGPEYLTDAMRLIWMHDYITIEYGGVSYTVDSLLFVPEWDEHGHIATIEAEFTSDTVLVMTGRAIGQTGVYDSPDVPVVDETTGGAYSDGYSNGFDI